MEDYRGRYEAWLQSEAIDEATKAELRAIQDDENEVKERFYCDLEFGTGGLRGVMAAGTNRMNVYTVRRATQGLLNYLLKKDPLTKEKGIAVGYDSRHHSPEFAREIALVAAGNGVKAYVFPSLRPTPMLSFAIRYLGCKSGVVVTASHNPSKYNGYKAYWEDGCQVPPPMDEEIIDEVNAVDLFHGVKRLEFDEAAARGLYVEIGPEVDEAFEKEVSKVLVDPDMVKTFGSELKVVYTPLHGAGRIPVQRALTQNGFVNTYVVPSQAEPNGDFPTAPYPNPEDPKVFEPAIALAGEVDGDLLIATDPDADRMGIMVRTKDGFRHFTGNMTGTLLLSYILKARKAAGRLPEDAFCVKTVVSTEMVRALCEEYQVELKEVLTGFKFIGQEMTRSAESGKGSYLFGFEESFGYLCGTFARDKDSVSAALLISEMALYYKRQGLTLVDALEALYEEYGYYKESLVSLTYEGIEGIEKIKAIMEEFRHHPKASYGGLGVLAIKDYEKGIDGLPQSNVLRFILEDNCWFCIRPSGTEPKIKFYFGVKGESEEAAEELNQAIREAVVPKA